MTLSSVAWAGFVALVWSLARFAHRPDHQVVTATPRIEMRTKGETKSLEGIALAWCGHTLAELVWSSLTQSSSIRSNAFGTLS